MSEYRTFKSGEILSIEDRAKLSPEDRKLYDTEQKIRKAMKIADDERASEDERAQATRTIAKLITKYQIDLGLLRDKQGGAKQATKIISFKIEVSNRYGLGAVRSVAISRAVIEPLGGKLVWWHRSTDSTKIPTPVRIWLPEELEGFARTLIASLLLQVETSLKVAAVQHKRELDWDWRLTKNDVTKLLGQFRKSYLASWGIEVGRRVQMGREDARQEASRETGKEIALVDTSALSKAAQEKWNEERGIKSRTVKTVIVSQDGAMAGRKDGRRAQLGTNEVGGHRTALIA